jgi:signal transduction histidine kinase
MSSVDMGTNGPDDRLILDAAKAIEGTHGRAPPAPLAGPTALVVAFFLLVVSALALSFILANLTQTRALVLHTNTNLRNVAEVLGQVRTAETGQRGYILTGERRYLAPYERAIQRVWSTYDELVQSVTDPDQLQRVRETRPLIHAKLNELAETVALRDQSFEAAVTVVQTDLGKRLMEDIERHLEAFRTTEEERLAVRTAQLERRAGWATWGAGATGFLALVSTGLGILWGARQREQARRFATERAFRVGLEQQVEARTAELTRVNQELDAFAYTISHDLRAPIRAVHGYAEAITEDHGAAMPDEARTYLQRIQGAASRMENLIQDILTYSRLAREKVSLRPVHLDAVVDQALASIAPSITAAGASVEVERPLPEVLAHPPILAQAVENLLSNAVKFAAPGARPHVRVRAQDGAAGRARLVVEDDGIGIAPEHQDRIFRPFERLHGIEAYPGTGIGLAIVRRAAERMGGSCGVASAPGQGSRFWMELQARDAGQAGLPQQPPREAA